MSGFVRWPIDSFTRIQETCRGFHQPPYKLRHSSLSFTHLLPLSLNRLCDFHNLLNTVMESSTLRGSTRRPSFFENDDGLASLADMEAGFSGSTHPFIMKSSRYNGLTRRGSFVSLSSFSVSSPRSARFHDSRCEEPHFLDACFLCKKPLGDNRDIFMYRGDTPFCSEECRHEQIEMDETKEKNFNCSASMKALMKDKRKSSPNKSENYSVRTGAVVAA